MFRKTLHGQRQRRSLAAGLLALTMAGAAPAGELLIEQRVTEDGTLLVRYTPPDGVRELPLFNRQDTMRTVWGEMATPLGHCATVALEPRVTITLAAGCSSAIFRVTPRLLNRYAVNEPALAVGSSAVMAYLGFYTAVLPGHAVRWRWMPGVGGHALVAGDVAGHPIERVLPVAQANFAAADGGDTQAGFDASGSHEYVLIGKAPMERLAGGVLVHDGVIDAALLAAVRNALSQVTARLTRAYGRPLPGPWVVVASDAPGLGGFRGDVTGGRMMSLRFDRAVPKHFVGAAQVHRFVAHEVTHWWDTGLYRTDMNRPWIHEGHADWMAELLMREAGLYDAEHWRSSLEAALNNCQFARGDRPSATLPPGFNRQDDTYACGQVLMLLAQSARPRDAAPVDIAASLFRGSTAPIDAEAVAQWSDGGKTGAMHRLLLDRQQGFLSAIKRDWSDVIEAVELRGGDALPAPVRSRLGSALMSELMIADCGRMGFWTQADHFRIEAVPDCRTLRGDMRIHRIAGVSPFDDPVGTWQAVRATCATGQAVSLSLGAGEPVLLACPTPVPDMPIQQLLRLRPQAVERLGLAP